MTGVRPAVVTAVFFIACLVGVYLTFVGLFGDGARDPLHPDRLLLWGLLFAAHGLLAAAGSRWGGGPWWAWTVLACAPSLALVALYTPRETAIVGLATLSMACVALGGVAGAWLARRRTTAAPLLR